MKKLDSFLKTLTQNFSVPKKPEVRTSFLP